jgi:hypothetical protein
MKRRHLCGVICGAFLIGSVAGVLYYRAAWDNHLPWICGHWLSRLIGADGEAGYDADLYESMIEFATFSAVIAWIILRLAISKRDRHSPSRV